ncbi:MAG: 2-isopropylmalate synthase [Deltaproteobacteria bacterium]|nr:2-isopropylmalate synthase [Deltaproteobacteria bacterium]MBT7150929.1 2-isopropylmalate synthase [Deltaproteobacteria bacterium]
MGQIIRIFDTTLRDGEQSPGCSMNAKEKLIMARQLAKLGVDTIEAGFPASSPGDFDSVQQIGHSVEGPMIVSLCRTSDADIQAGVKALKGSKNWGIHTFIATSDLHLKKKLNIDRKTAVKKAIRAIQQAKKHTENVEFSAEDATRSDPAFLVEIFSAAIKAGATILNVPDTVGYITPHEFTKLIQLLQNEVVDADKVLFSVHCHNDLGLAAANSLAAVGVGAQQIECTVNGIGERAGNASLEEIVMAFKVRNAYFNKTTNVDTTQIFPSSRLLTKLTGTMIPPNKAIVGANAFAHESGIHQAGVIKDTLTYEIMKPESIGLSLNQLVLGKHSGRAALSKRIQTLGYDVSKEELQKIFENFKQLADKKKVVYDEDLEILIMQERSSDEEKYELLSVNVTAGTETIPTATVVMNIDKVRMPAQACLGDGPVDAALNTIREIVNIPCVLTSFVIKSITGGTDAQGVVSVTIEWEGIKASGRGSHTDIVIASAAAFVNALNRLDLLKKSHHQMDETDDLSGI